MLKTIIARLTEYSQKAIKLNDEMQEQTTQGGPVWHNHESIDDHLFEVSGAIEQLEGLRDMPDDLQTFTSKQIWSSVEYRSSRLPNEYVSLHDYQIAFARNVAEKITNEFVKIFVVEGDQILVTKDFSEDEDGDSPYKITFRLPPVEGVSVFKLMGFSDELVRDEAFTKVTLEHAKGVRDEIAGILIGFGFDELVEVG